MNASSGQSNWAAFVIEQQSSDVQALVQKFGMEAEKTYTYLTNAVEENSGMFEIYLGKSLA